MSSCESWFLTRLWFLITLNVWAVDFGFTWIVILNFKRVCDSFSHMCYYFWFRVSCDDWFHTLNRCNTNNTGTVLGTVISETNNDRFQIRWWTRSTRFRRWTCPCPPLQVITVQYNIYNILYTCRHTRYKYSYKWHQYFTLVSPIHVESTVPETCTIYPLE